MRIFFANTHLNRLELRLSSRTSSADDLDTLHNDDEKRAFIMNTPIQSVLLCPLLLFTLFTSGCGGPTQLHLNEMMVVTSISADLDRAGALKKIQEVFDYQPSETITYALDKEGFVKTVRRDSPHVYKTAYIARGDREAFLYKRSWEGPGMFQFITGTDTSYTDYSARFSDVKNVIEWMEVKLGKEWYVEGIVYGDVLSGRSADIHVKSADRNEFLAAWYVLCPKLRKPLCRPAGYLH